MPLNTGNVSQALVAFLPRVGLINLQIRIIYHSIFCLRITLTVRLGEEVWLLLVWILISSVSFCSGFWRAVLRLFESRTSLRFAGLLKFCCIIAIVRDCHQQDYKLSAFVVTQLPSKLLVVSQSFRYVNYRMLRNWIFYIYLIVVYGCAH